MANGDKLQSASILFRGVGTVQAETYIFIASDGLFCWKWPGFVLIRQ